jgi:hypothetical protein
VVGWDVLPFLADIAGKQKELLHLADRRQWASANVG